MKSRKLNRLQVDEWIKVLLDEQRWPLRLIDIMINVATISTGR
jgi:hypothetical protein